MASPFTLIGDRVEIRDEVLAAVDECLGSARTVAGLRASATEHRAHARSELAKAERLGDVVVSADVESRHAIAFTRACRQHDDRHRRGVGTRPQDPAHLEPAQHGKVQIENDQIGRALVDRLERAVSRADDLDFDVATLFETVLDEPSNVLLIVNDQHVSAGRRRGRSCVGRKRCLTPSCIALVLHFHLGFTGPR